MKKKSLMLVFCLFFVVIGLNVVQAADNCGCPDINNDGLITTKDIDLFDLQKSASYIPSVDVNKDGRLDVLDRVCISNKIGSPISSIQSCVQQIQRTSTRLTLYTDFDSAVSSSNPFDLKIGAKAVYMNLGNISNVTVSGNKSEITFVANRSLDALKTSEPVKLLTNDLWLAPSNMYAFNTQLIGLYYYDIRQSTIKLAGYVLSDTKLTTGNETIYIRPSEWNDRYHVVVTVDNDGKYSESYEYRYRSHFGFDESTPSQGLGTIQQVQKPARSQQQAPTKVAECKGVKAWFGLC